MKKYDAIIIGSGPSGLSSAISLYNYGIKNILVIEKSKFPRYKCCAGYVTNKTKKLYEEFGLNFKKCNYSLIKDFNIFYKYNKRQNIINKFLYTNSKIDRVDLDNGFFLLAKKNILIHEKEFVIKHDINKNIIKTNKNEYEYKYLIFADGTNGYGSKYQKNNKKNIALQYIFENDNKNEIQIHFGITSHGYAWASSYNGITNIGITDLYEKGVNYNKILCNFIKKLGYENIDKNKITGAFTPILIDNSIINNNIYFVGDVLGACDPFTLSGLRYGLASGKKCAESIYKNNKKIYLKYTRKLNVKFKTMYFLSNIFYTKGILFLVFNIGCKYFSKLISYVFNNYFVSKK